MPSSSNSRSSPGFSLFTLFDHVKQSLTHPTTPSGGTNIARTEPTRGEGKAHEDAVASNKGIYDQLGDEHILRREDAHDQMRDAPVHIREDVYEPAGGEPSRPRDSRQSRGFSR